MFNLLQLYERTNTKTQAIAYLQEVGILHSVRFCAEGHAMKLALSQKEDRWRCTRAGCRCQRQLKSGTWLQGSHITYQSACLFVYCWAHEMTSFEFTMRELEFVSSETIVDWNHYMREICAEKLLRNQAFIGGDGMSVEIDESLFVRRKGNVGRRVNQQWVFGGICRETHDCFLYAVADRTESTLLPIIAESIRPGTTIISDCWAAYNNISNIPDRSYTHLTVNHSRNFVDPTTGACTNMVESLWGKAKYRNKRHWGTHKTMVDSYLCEFMWRKRYAGTDPHAAILRDIVEAYPLFDQ
jgi:transposase-like protein